MGGVGFDGRCSIGIPKWKYRTGTTRGIVRDHMFM